MFVFGDPVETAKMHLGLYLNEEGPKVPDAHYDELEEQDLRNLLTYLYIALHRAHSEGLGEAVVEVLTEWYDEAFTALVEASEEFREATIQGATFPPGGAKFRPKYLEIARKASES